MSRNAPTKRRPKVTIRQALIVLGMHRAGTSALGGVLAKLGVQPPKNLMPPTPENPRGYWESTAFMKMHDRILESAGTCWSEWDIFNPEWIDSPAGETFKSDVSALLQDEYDDARLILIKDPRMCRLFPIWERALKELGITAKAIIPLRHPIEVAKSLESRDQLTTSQGKLLWLRHVLDAECNSRSVARAFIRYDDLLNDWQTQMNRLSMQLNLKWPRRSSATEAEINDFLTPQLRHHSAAGENPPANSAISRWTADTYQALISLVDDPQHNSSLELLDSIRHEFNESSRIYAPVVQEQRQLFVRRIEDRESEMQRLSSELTELASRHDLLDQERKANWQLYDAERKTLAELRLRHQEREDAYIALTSRYEVLHAEMASHAEKAAATLASEAAIGRKLEKLEAAYTKLSAEHQRALEGASEEVKQLKRAANSAEEALKQQLADTDEQHNTEIARLKDEARSSEEALKRQLADTVEQHNAEIVQLKDAAQSATEVLRLEFGETISQLRVEMRKLEEDLQLAEESLEERFAETAQLTKTVFDLEDKLASERATTEAERLRWNARLEDENRKVAARDSTIRALRATVHEAGSRIRALEQEIDVQSRLILEYRTELETIRSGKYQRLATAIQGWARLDREVPSTTDAKSDDELLRRSHLFDSDWYLSHYPDVGTGGMDPIQHYLLHGAEEGRDPSPAFSTTDYVSRYPDVTEAGANPLIHYLKYGRREGRLISALPDPDEGQ